MDKRLDRLALLLGDAKVASLKDKTVLVCGLGGVGGTALESLARSGIGSFLIVDFDYVEISNLNRQILFVESDIGKLKVSAALQRLQAISKDIHVETFPTHVDGSLFSQLKNTKIDFVIDAIDSPLAKQELIEFCLTNNIPFISSSGMANRLDPTALRLGNLEETAGDPLAKKMRMLFRKSGVELSKIPVVFSKEKPIASGPTSASIMNVPSAAGLAMSSYCLEILLK